MEDMAESLRIQLTQDVTARFDRKIQLELAPPTPEVAEKENEGQQVKPEAEDVRNRHCLLYTSRCV